MAAVVIIMGSKADLEHCKKIARALEDFKVKCILRVASAHKTPQKVLQIIDEYKDDDVVFITVAGRSNALSGFVDANTSKPVIAAPPYSDKFSGVDIFSTLRMPSGVAPMVVLEPENAAIAAVKILAIYDKRLQQTFMKYQAEKKRLIEDADKEVIQ
jgi:5-(carboxyamino)imidazole ribonucleotide mutase